MLKDIVTEKKESEKCEDHRNLSLITHASKISTKIIHNRIEAKVMTTWKKIQLVLGAIKQPGRL